MLRVESRAAITPKPPVPSQGGGVVDVTVHVDETLRLDEMTQVEKQLVSEEGIVAVHFQPHHPHLAILQYDPAKVGLKKILTLIGSRVGVPHEHPQLHAQLIGL
jgi:hypothetical protein